MSKKLSEVLKGKRRVPTGKWGELWENVLKNEKLKKPLQLVVIVDAAVEIGLVKEKDRTRAYTAMANRLLRARKAAEKTAKKKQAS